MRHEEYQGWTNYETWQASLWIGNDEGLYRIARYIAQSATADEQADILRKSIETELLEGKPASLETDILTAWMREVDWTEVAEAQRDE